MSQVTAELIREHAADCTRDLPFKREGDLAFSDPDILSALQAAAREFNSVPPFSVRVSADSLSADTNMFLNIAVSYLFERKMRLMAPQLTVFTAGNVQTDTDRQLYEALKSTAEELRKRFLEEARAIKAHHNMLAFCGPIG